MKQLFYLTLFVFCFFMPCALNAAEDVVINVSEDAYVQGGTSANDAKGVTDSEMLMIRNHAAPVNKKKVYLKFVIPDELTINQVQAAMISLHVSSCNAGIGAPTWNVYSASNDWSESSITWNNQPADGAISTTYKIPNGFASIAAGYNILIDVTTLARMAVSTNQRTFSVQIFPSTTDLFDNVDIFSKENTADTQKIPQLILSSEAIDDGKLNIVYADSIIARVKRDRLAKSVTTIDRNVNGFLPNYKPSTGSHPGYYFDDIDYTAQSRSNWIPLIHLERLREMGLAYTHIDSEFYGDDDFYNKIVEGYKYWYSRNVNNTQNWYYNRVAHPHRLGEAFIAVYGGIKDITKETVFKQLTDRWKDRYGHPDIPADATTAGANKTNIAMHWIYRSALTRNKEDLEFAVERAFLQLGFTTGEGLQHDYSYRQHGAQLYLAGYGREFIQLGVRQGSYLIGTPYPMPDESRTYLSNYIRDTYLKIIRGERLSYNIFGRSISRENSTSERGLIALLSFMSEIDPDYVQEYDDAIKRISKQEPASYNITPLHKYFYRGEYTLHIRPEYMFDVRMASSRMVRSEYDIYENTQGLFLTDGGTCIMVDGEEYGTIIPLWDWRRIPGTTVPELETMRRANSYIMNGRSAHAGGVTDGMYGVTSFEMINDQELYAYNDDTGWGGTPSPQNPRLPALDFGAKKSWFIFENEIVCLGASLYSGHDEVLTTTVNQCRRVGDVIASVRGEERIIGLGKENIRNPEWILNDKVAYFFPERSDVYIENKTETAKWSDVNLSFATDTPFEGHLFTAWIDHGVKPQDEKYAYIIVPNADLEKARNYSTNNVTILANNDSVQAVYHNELGIYGFTFFKSAGFRKGDLAIEVDAAAAIMIKDVDQDEVTLWVADPQKSGKAIGIGIETARYKERRSLVCETIASPHTGQSVELKLNESTPLSTGKAVNLDRSDWIITTSSVGPIDGTVGGNDPYNIIDGNLTSAFLFVKPGLTHEGVSVPSVEAGGYPNFTIDMQQPKEMSFLVYRHRVSGNTGANLRVNKASFLGKDNEEDEFIPILTSVDVPTNIDEVKIDFPEKETYQYIRFQYEGWTVGSGNTMQVSEFNVGNTVMLNIEESEYTPNTNVDIIPASQEYLSVYPNPLRKGDILSIKTSLDSKNITIEIFDVLGRQVKFGKQLTIDTNELNAGVYTLIAKEMQGTKTATTKIIIN